MKALLDRVLDSIVMGPNGCHISTYSVGSTGECKRCVRDAQNAKRNA